MSEPNRGGERGGRPTSPSIITSTTFVKESRNPLSILQDNISINSTTRVSSFTFDTLPSSSISISTTARNLSNNNTIDRIEYTHHDNNVDFQSPNNVHFTSQPNNLHSENIDAPTTSNNSTTGENQAVLSSSASEISNMDMSVVSTTTASDAFYTVVDANINQTKPRMINVGGLQNANKRADISSSEAQKSIPGTCDLALAQAQSIAISTWEGDSVDTGVKDYLMSAQIRRQKVSELKEGEFIPFSPLGKSPAFGSRLESSSGDRNSGILTLFTPGSVPPIGHTVRGSTATSLIGGNIPSIFSTIMDVEEESVENSMTAYSLSKTDLVEPTTNSTEEHGREEISNSREVPVRNVIETESEYVSTGVKSNVSSGATPSPVVSNFVIGRRSTLGILGNENYIGRLPNIDQGSESEGEMDEMSIENNIPVENNSIVTDISKPGSASTLLAHERDNVVSSTDLRRGVPFIHQSLLDDSADDMSIDSTNQATSTLVTHQLRPNIQTQSKSNSVDATTQSTRTNIVLNLSAFDYDESYRENDNDTSKARNSENEQEHENADISMDITRGNINDQFVLKPVEFAQQTQPLSGGFVGSVGFTSPATQRRRGIDRIDKAERSVTKRSSILVSPRERRTSLRAGTLHNNGSEDEEDEKDEGKGIAEKTSAHMHVNAMQDNTSHDISAMDMSITKALPESVIALVNPLSSQISEEIGKNTKESKESTMQSSRGSLGFSFNNTSLGNITLTESSPIAKRQRLTSLPAVNDSLFQSISGLLGDASGEPSVMPVPPPHPDRPSFKNVPRYSTTNGADGNLTMGFGVQDMSMDISMDITTAAPGTNRTINYANIGARMVDDDMSLDINPTNEQEQNQEHGKEKNIGIGESVDDNVDGNLDTLSQVSHLSNFSNMSQFSNISGTSQLRSTNTVSKRRASSKATSSQSRSQRSSRASSRPSSVLPLQSAMTSTVAEKWDSLLHSDDEAEGMVGVRKDKDHPISSTASTTTTTTITTIGKGISIPPAHPPITRDRMSSFGFRRPSMDPDITFSGLTGMITGVQDLSGMEDQHTQSNTLLNAKPVQSGPKSTVKVDVIPHANIAAESMRNKAEKETASYCNSALPSFTASVVNTRGVSGGDGDGDGDGNGDILNTSSRVAPSTVPLLSRPRQSHTQDYTLGLGMTLSNISTIIGLENSPSKEIDESRNIRPSFTSPLSLDEIVVTTNNEQVQVQEQGQEHLRAVSSNIPRSETENSVADKSFNISLFHSISPEKEQKRKNDGENGGGSDGGVITTISASAPGTPYSHGSFGSYPQSPFTAKPTQDSGDALGSPSANFSRATVSNMAAMAEDILDIPHPSFRDLLRAVGISFEETKTRSRRDSEFDLAGRIRRASMMVPFGDTPDEEEEEKGENGQASNDNDDDAGDDNNGASRNQSKKIRNTSQLDFSVFALEDLSSSKSRGLRDQLYSSCVDTVEIADYANGCLVLQDIKDDLKSKVTNAEKNLETSQASPFTRLVRLAKKRPLFNQAQEAMYFLRRHSRLNAAQMWYVWRSEILNATRLNMLEKKKASRKRCG